MDACVDTEDLVAMAEGHLAADRVEAVLVHVDRCRICAEIIANLARDAAPRDVGRYQLGRVLGAGAMGVVYDAWDPELRRRVAVKLVRPERTDDDVSHARILREARALARISHPNVVAVYDVGDTAGQIYLATELVDGETMLTWCDTRDTPAIVDAWIQAARGLAAAHAQGFVHRDVKPANVFVGRDGRVRIGDFGLARSAPGDTVIDLNDPTLSGPRRRALTDGAFVGGTPAYMAPEQWRGAGDARSDQFALCVAICESLTGIRPDPDELPPIAPGALAAVLSRGLRATPSERFASMDELADALAGALAGALAQRPQLAQLRRRRIVVAVGVVGLLASIAWTSSSERAACEPAQLPGRVWALPQRAVVSAKLPPGIVAHVDAWLAGWSAMAADICATDAALALRARRRQCLDDALADAADTLARWQTSPVTPLAAQYAIETWQRPARCAVAAVAAAPEPQPAQAFAIAPLRARLTATLAALRERPDHLPVRLSPAGLFELRDVLAGARALGFAPFVVEVELELARRIGDRDGAIALLREAMTRATTARDTRLRTAATAALIRMLDAAHVGEAIQLADALRPELVATADHEAEGELEVALGNALRWAHRLDEAIAAYERARRSFHEAYGPDSQHEVIVLTALDGAYTQIDWDSPGATAARAALAAIARTTGVPRPPSPHDSPEQLLAALGDLAATTQPGGAEEANVHFSLGALHALLGNREQALAHYRRYTTLAARLGIRDTTTASAAAMIASLLVDLGRPAEALPAADQAVVHALAVGLDTELAQALTIQGAARLLSNQLAAAREPLARALAIREAGNAGAAERSRTRFLYARALAPVDRRRALELATTARVELQGFLRALGPSNVAPYLRAAQQARLVEIERWLRAN